MRIPVKSIYRNQPAVNPIIKYIMSIKGVKSAKANIITGKVLILFDEDIVSDIYIERQINIYMKKSKISHDSNIIKINNINEETSLPISFENIKPPLHNSMQVPWHTMDKNEIKTVFNTDLKYGLTGKMASKKNKGTGIKCAVKEKEDFTNFQNSEKSKRFLGKIAPWSQCIFIYSGADSGCHSHTQYSLR
jgi:Ca2+-transporting ATPase